MIKEICNDLKNILAQNDGLKSVDTLAGLAQTLTYKIVDETGNSFTKKMPVSYDTNISDNCEVSPEKSLVPDSRNKGIIYFEENGGVTFNRLSNNREKCQANLILVCWLNRNNSIGQTYGKMVKNTYDEIMSKFRENYNSDFFNNIKISSLRLRQDPNIFSKYTYDESVLQYLRPPFEYFVIDLRVTFINGCKKEIILNPKEC